MYISCFVIPQLITLPDAADSCSGEGGCLLPLCAGLSAHSGGSTTASSSPGSASTSGLEWSDDMPPLPVPAGCDSPLSLPPDLGELFE